MRTFRKVGMHSRFFKKIPFFLSVLALFNMLLMGCQLPQKKRFMTAETQEMLDKPSIEAVKNSTQGDPLGFSGDLGKSLGATLSPIAGTKEALFEKRFDIVADQVPAQTFFLSLVEDTHYNITVHPLVQGNISLQLKKVTIPQILETIQNVYGFDYRQTAQGIEILPATLQTRAFPVNYLDISRNGKSSVQVSASSLSAGAADASSEVKTNSTSDFWKELRTAVETIIGSAEGRKVAISPLSSLIIVQAMPDELRRVEDFLKKAQLSLNRQVILEAKIIEVQLNEAYQAGINWGLISGRLSAAQSGAANVIGGIGATGNGFPISSEGLPGTINMQPGTGTTSLAGSAVPAFGGMVAMAMNYKNISAFLDLLQAQGDVHVLSNPRVSTLNNQKALIKAGDDQYYITNVSSTTTTSGTGLSESTPSVTFTPFFSGVSLDVTPQITADDEITLHIHPTISSVTNSPMEYTLASQKTIVQLAKSSVRESDSMVKARNGEMVIIGGLIQNKTMNIKEGIPILGKLPVIGGLFSQKAQNMQKSEVVILIRPIIANAGAEAREADKALSRIQDMNEEIIERENALH